jgi:hypothetical protein
MASVNVFRVSSQHEFWGFFSRMGGGGGAGGGGVVTGTSVASSMSSMGGGGGLGMSGASGAAAAAPAPRGPRKAGMKLGSDKPKATDLLQAMINEGEVNPGSPTIAAAAAGLGGAGAGGAGGAGGLLGAPGSGAAAAAGIMASGGGGGGDGPEKVSLAVVERVTARLDREGGVESVEVRGDLTLRVTDPAAAHVLARLTLGPNKGFQFKTHPNIDKAKFADESVLALKDLARSFPVNTDLAVLKWRYATTESSEAPLVVSCWPSASGGTSQVTVEYELRDGFVLHDVEIAVPCPDARPKVTNDVGSYTVSGGRLLWKIDMVDAGNANSVLELTVPAASADAFFPVEVRFASRSLFCQVKVDTVAAVTDGAPVPFRPSAALLVESYSVV